VRTRWWAFCFVFSERVDRGFDRQDNAGIEEHFFDPSGRQIVGIFGEKPPLSARANSGCSGPIRWVLLRREPRKLRAELAKATEARIGPDRPLLVASRYAKGGHRGGGLAARQVTETATGAGGHGSTPAGQPIPAATATPDLAPRRRWRSLVPLLGQQRAISQRFRAGSGFSWCCTQKTPQASGGRLIGRTQFRAGTQVVAR
jgi:hypothetical protein